MQAVDAAPSEARRATSALKFPNDVHSRRELDDLRHLVDARSHVGGPLESRLPDTPKL